MTGVYSNRPRPMRVTAWGWFLHFFYRSVCVCLLGPFDFFDRARWLGSCRAGFPFLDPCDGPVLFLERCDGPFSTKLVANW